MASRNPNILKIRKQKRQGRRAYLTSVYSLIQVPRRVGISDIPDDAVDLFAYRKRGNTTGHDPWLDRIFPGVKQESERRKFALQQADEERLLAMVADEDVCDYITLRDSKMQHKRITFIYNRQYTRCFFIEVSYAEGDSYAKKSNVYGGRDRAMFDFEHKRIKWSEYIELTTLALVLPRRA